MKSRTRWATMSPAQRSRALAVIVFHIGTAAFGLVKLARRPAERVRGRKWIWGIAIAANLAAGIVVRWGRLAAPRPDPEPAPHGP
jgi:hypothetical protein